MSTPKPSQVYRVTVRPKHSQVYRGGGPAYVVNMIGSADEARRKIVRERLEERLVDFYYYLTTSHAGDAEAVATHVDAETIAGLAHEYMDEVLEHEDGDPIGQLAYVP